MLCLTSLKIGTASSVWKQWHGALRNISANTFPPFACDSPFDGAADTSAHLQLQLSATPAQQWLTCSFGSNWLCSFKAEDLTGRNLMSAPLRKKEILQVFGYPMSRAAVPAVTGQRCGHWTFLVLFKWQEKVWLAITDPWLVTSGVTEIPQQSQNELSKNYFSSRWSMNGPQMSKNLFWMIFVILLSHFLKHGGSRRIIFFAATMTCNLIRAVDLFFLF